jgi:tetratricopeptide (TPR) repeat protein
VAQGDISRTAIYFVETGKAKPSMETLRLIATRTNKPLDFFLGESATLDGDAALAEVERLVAVGDNLGAVAAAEALLIKNPQARIAAYARFHLSNALTRLGQPGRGRTNASAARTYFEQAGDVVMVAECMGWEAGAAQLMQDPVALSLAEEALARCRSIDPVPVTTEARLLAILGHVRMSRHEYAKAIQAYEQAVAVGAAFADLRRLSYIYGSLSLAYQENGQYAQAAQYSRRAMTIYETLHDRLNIGWAENNLALLLLKQGDLVGAVRHAENSLRTIEEMGVESGKAHVLMTMAELELARSNFYAASRYATAALELAQRLGEAPNVGEAHVWLGRVAEAKGDEAAADTEFSVAFQMFESVDALEWQARGHAIYAEILEARGDLAGANRHLRHALAALGTRPVVADHMRIAIA